MEWIELGELGEINNGYAFESKKYQETGIRIIRITNVQKGYIEDSNPKFYIEKDMENLDRFYLFENDILVSLTGNVGRVARVTKEMLPAALNQRVASIKPKENISNDYLFYMMNSDKFESLCINESKGVAQKNLGTTSLSKIKIPVPEKNIQKQIVEILDEAQSLIDNRKEQIKLLNDLIESVFYDMFGDPVRNNMGWEVKKLGEFIRHMNNGLSRRGKDEDGDIVLRLVELQAKFIDYSDINRIKLNNSEKDRYILNDRDILFARVNGNPNYVGRSAIYNQKENIPVYFNDHIIRATIDFNRINPIYVINLLNSEFGIHAFKEHIKTSAGQYTISQGGINNIEFIIPPIQLQNQFAEKVQLIESQKELIQDSLKLLEDNYNNLMQRAFKGELFN